MEPLGIVFPHDISMFGGRLLRPEGLFLDKQILLYACVASTVAVVEIKAIPIRAAYVPQDLRVSSASGRRVGST